MGIDLELGGIASFAFWLLLGLGVLIVLLLTTIVCISSHLLRRSNLPDDSERIEKVLEILESLKDASTLLRQRQDKFESMLSQVLNGEQDENVIPEKAAGEELQIHSEQPGESGGTQRKKKKKKMLAAPLEDAAESAAMIAEAPATQFSSRALSFPPNNVFTEIFKMSHWGLGRDEDKKDSKDSA